MSRQNPGDNNNAKREGKKPRRMNIRVARKMTRKDFWKDLRGLMYPNWRIIGEDNRETLETNFEVNYFIALGTNRSIPSTATSATATNITGTNIDFGEASTSGRTNNAGPSEAGTTSNAERSNFSDLDSGASTSGIESGLNSDSIHNSSETDETNDAKKSSSEEAISSPAGSSNESVLNNETTSPNIASTSAEGDLDTNAPSTSSGIRASGIDINVSSEMPSTSSINPYDFFCPPASVAPSRKPHRPFQGGVLTSIANLANSYYSTDLRDEEFEPQPSTSQSAALQLPPSPIPRRRGFGMPAFDDEEDHNNNSGEIDPIQLAIAQSFRF